MTFRHFYEACVVAFLLQGVLLVPLVVAAGFAWFRQGARLAAVEAALGRDRKRRDGTLAAVLAALPKLKRLNCAACGGVLALDVDAATCVRCRTSFPPPSDYAATVSLRRRLKRLASAALVYWYAAWALTAWPVRWLLRLLVIGEPALFMVVAVGAASYNDTWLDRLFERTGEQVATTLMVMGFGGFILWMVVFLMLASLSRELRRKLPAFPAAPPEGVAATEFATCRACGGGVHYDGRAFAALCGYCGVENYRAEFSRRERGKAEAARAETRATLFGAMGIIEDFTGTFVILMGILVTGFALLVGVMALKG